MHPTLLRAAATALLSLGLTACDAAEPGDPDAAGCDGGKCDTPGGTPEEQCRLRQSEVLDSSQRGFTPDAIRWACADVEGVNTVGQDDRGQEYCEYYAIVRPPGEDVGVDLGRQKSRAAGDVTPMAICLEGEGSRSDCRTEITEDDLFQWEDNPDAVVGACMFTSWHVDTPGPLPACDDSGCSEQATVFGLPLTEKYAQMKISFNSNAAASDLVQRCLDRGIRGETPMPARWDGDDPLTEPFYRGCMAVQDIFGTGWRRSDPSVCAVANRLAECGCGVPGIDPSELGVAVVPPQPTPDGEITLRGFKLGTWGDAKRLPPGCRYVDTGEDMQTAVVCDLTAADVVGSLNDVKEKCRELYGNQVVVHVPLPAAAIECSPPEGDLAAGCGTQPWNIGREG